MVKKKKYKCPYRQILLGEYALGTASPEDRRRVERHLATCRACRRALAETQRVYGLIRPFALAQPAPGFGDRLDVALEQKLGWDKPKREMPTVPADLEPIITPALPLEPVAAPARPAAALEPVEELTAPAVSERRAARRRWLFGRWRAWAAAFGTAAAAAVVAIVFFKIMPFGPTGEMARPTERVTPAPRADYPVEAKKEFPAEKPIAVAPAGPKEEVAPEPTPKLTIAEPRPAEAPLRTRAPAATALEAPKEETPVADVKKEPPLATIVGRSPVTRGEPGRTGGEMEYPAVAEKTDDGKFAALPPALADELDPRIAADVERLTASDGALLDYLVPNGGVLTYFYELPPDEQWAVLSRLKEETENEDADALLLSP